ncbi:MULTISPECIES: Trp biosynthesis-associated membrane protein [unclassified Micromonospora]|uniref:Trp biosynthesis-associated membrane protein n=1 Tax=unclassified Micromonospora TaxID=2617518 RepID=UPI001C21AFDB|nr:MULTISPECIES: Trp biosynthesis-associated membrane protein [unclassified Micromonospora]MBU8856121.1 Trp biosynthesis-associated membrane protein [Micromonospora sp. WMMB482]MDM4781726.1 Trp biosynthesis-associated membrane protein [Micromonospora sp. b486]
MNAPGTTAPAARGRRELAYAVLLCLAGAGLACWAVTRTWAVEVTARGSLPSERTGTELLPWVLALTYVGLAGGGAVLATRGRLRRLLGVLLVGVGVAVAAGGGIGLTEAGVSLQWPALVLAGGLALAAGGASTALRGDGWPAMGARYERRSAPADEPGRPAVERGTRDAWDALDRGEDPTVS